MTKKRDMHAKNDISLKIIIKAEAKPTKAAKRSAVYSDFITGVSPQGETVQFQHIGK